MPRSRTLSGAPGPGANPVLVEATRGPAVESTYRGAAVVADAAGRIVEAWGDGDRSVFPRSAIKPLQALALVETGTADRFGLTDRHLALACASHGGEARHVRLVRGWLKRLGLADDDLECGAHPPLDPAAAAAMQRARRRPTRAHNNCSGKHAGMLAMALHLGAPTRGYSAPEHPVQRRWIRMIGDLGGVDAEAAPWGIDGCGIPTVALPLAAIARAAARLADPATLPADLAAAARRVLAAMAAHPFLVAGTDRFDTEVMEAVRGAALVKAGAEGVHIAILPGRSLGVAVKIDSGSKVAAECATAAILARLGILTAARRAALGEAVAPRLRNWGGVETGAVRPAAGWLA